MKTLTLIPQITSFVLVAVLAALPAFGAEEWGSIKGRFVYDGQPIKLAPLNINKDVEYCTKHNPVDETILMGEEGGLQNAVVYIRVPRGKSLDVHPEYEEELKEPVVLDNHGCAFRSHITLVRTGQPFILKNSDTIGHNTNAALLRNGQFNVIIPAEGESEMTFSKAESLPLPVQCNIHPWMKGYLYVRDDPYMAVSGEDGTFEIANIPAGEHEFQFWHEAVGYLKDVEYEGGAANRRGRADLTIVADETLDLGEIHVPASLLK